MGQHIFDLLQAIGHILFGISIVARIGATNAECGEERVELLQGLQLLETQHQVTIPWPLHKLLQVKDRMNYLNDSITHRTASLTGE